MSTRFPYSPQRTPPIPAVVLALVSPDGSRRVTDISAHVDTAADGTIIPLGYAQQLGLQPINQVQAVGAGGIQILLDIYSLVIDISGVAAVPINVYAHPNEPYVLLGRDIVKLFTITLDGPKQTVEFH